MTTRRPTVEPDAWDDGRLATAFVERYDRPAPIELTPTILEHVRATRRRPRWWPELGRSALAWSTALVVLAVVGVFVLPGALRTLTGTGPATGARTFKAYGISFTVPSSWTAHDALAVSSGGSTIAIAGTLPVDPACGDAHVEINCYYERRLDPSTVSVVVGSRGFPSDSVATWAPDNATVEQVTVDGYPAVLATYQIQPDDYYRADAMLTYLIPFDEAGTNAYSIDVEIRGPGTDRLLAEVEAMVQSFRADNLAPPPATSRAVATPYQSFEPSPAVAGFPAVVVGLPVRSVADALARFERPDLGDTEIAVAGWYSAPGGIRACPSYRVDDSPLIERCGFSPWLSASDRPILSKDGQMIWDPSSDPSIRPRLLPPVDPVALGSGGPGAGVGGVTKPLAVVLVGHIHDGAASSCPADEEAACEQTFVVDLVTTSAGILLDQPSSFLGDLASARLAPGEALQAARDRVAGYATVLSIGLFNTANPPWLPASLGGARRLTWFVRGYRTLLDDETDPRAPGTPAAGWLAIDDATGTITGTLAQGVPAPETPFPFAPPPDGFPTTIEGLPVRTVADVVNGDRPPGLPETPIAVAGWFSQLPIHPCPSPDNGSCERDTLVLAGTDRQLVTYGASGFATTAPADGPGLNPAILPGGAPPPNGNPDGSPRRAIFIVHAGDRRADRNGPGDPVGPRDLVLDQVAWLDGADQPAATWIEPGIHPARDAQSALVIGGDLGTGRTWAIFVSASHATEAGVGDLFAGRGDPIVWVIRLVGANPLASSGGLPGWGSIVVDDASGTIVDTTWTSPGP
jgi:hypothetical protein